MFDRRQFLLDYLRDIQEQRLPELRAQLDPLVSGEMRLGERKGNGPWTDTTQRQIEYLLRAIAQYETIAARLRNEEVL
ncbi:MAG: hypothetical protein ABSC25_17180 [Roseiarcus sp.]|jgi:putative hemolysin